MWKDKQVNISTYNHSVEKIKINTAVLLLHVSDVFLLQTVDITKGRGNDVKLPK